MVEILEIDQLWTMVFQDVFDLLVKAYGADPRIRDNAGKTPRQYMVASSQLQGGDMQVMAMSSDTFRQLKDRRRSRRQVSMNLVMTSWNIAIFNKCGIIW